VSSIAALGDLKEFEDTVTEETEWNPEVAHSDYSISKYGAEMEVWRGLQEGLAVTVINPGIILGAGFWDSGSGLLFTNVANGLSFFTKGSFRICRCKRRRQKHDSKYGKRHQWRAFYCHSGQYFIPRHRKKHRDGHKSQSTKTNTQNRG